MDEQLSFWDEVEVDARWFHSFELSENTSGHGYVSTKVMINFVSISNFQQTIMTPYKLQKWTAVEK